MIGVPKRSDNGMDGSHIKEDFHPEALSIALDRRLPAIRRQIGVVAAVCVIAALAGVGWILSAAPRYTADALILIDNKRVRAVEDAYDINTPGSDAASSVVDSQVEVVKSENVATSVVRKLDLLSDPEFNAHNLPGQDLISRVRQGIRQSFGWENAA